MSCPAQDKRPFGRACAPPEDYTVVDIETTGLSSKTSEILEIGAVCVRKGEIVDTFQELVHPNRPIPPAITLLTGITDDMVKNADPIEEVLPRFLYFRGNDLIVGHNVSFDLGFLCDRARSFSLDFSGECFDTLFLARRALPQLSHHRLSDLADYYHIEAKDAHRALADCLTTHAVLRQLLACMR